MPLRIRQGSDQPFNVATARYGLPLGGVSGGCMAGEAGEPISGSAASAPFATAPAATASPALLKNLRRESMIVPYGAAATLLSNAASSCELAIQKSRRR